MLVFELGEKVFLKITHHFVIISFYNYLFITFPLIFDMDGVCLEILKSSTTAYILIIV